MNIQTLWHALREVRSRRRIALAGCALLLGLIVVNAALAQQTVKVNPALLKMLKPSKAQPPASGKKPKPTLTTTHATMQNSAASQATMHSMQNLQLKPMLTAPGHLGYTHDSKRCAKDHDIQRGARCAALDDGSKVVMLTWNWAPCRGSNCITRISGFRIYRPASKTTAWIGAGGSIHPGKDTLVATVAPSQTAYALTSFGPGECFVVRAYSADRMSMIRPDGTGGKESPDSNKFCLAKGMRVGTRKVKFSKPTWKQSSYGVNSKRDMAASCAIAYSVAGWGEVFGLVQASPGMVSVHGGVVPDAIVGNRQILHKRAVGCDTRAVVALRSGVYFDLSSLANQPVSQATLSFNLAAGQWSGDTSAPTPTPISCAYLVGDAIRDWTQGWTAQNGAIPYDTSSVVRLPGYRERVSAPLQANVTAIVQGWMADATAVKDGLAPVNGALWLDTKTGSTVSRDPNYGFVLAMEPGNDEREHSTNSTCLSKYDHFQLTVMTARTL